MHLPVLYSAAELTKFVEMKAACDQAIGIEAWARQAKDGELSATALDPELPLLGCPGGMPAECGRRRNTMIASTCDVPDWQ